MILYQVFYFIFYLFIVIYLRFCFSCSIIETIRVQEIERMYKQERIRKIKEYITEHKQADVQTLGSILNVSGATIRTDLNELEKEGFIVRFHGGAALNSAGYHEAEINMALRCSNIEYDPNKEELGEIASHLIKEREWVFLGPGTTSYYIAKALSQRNNIFVLTNNMLVSNILGANPACQTLVIGGQVHSDGMYTLPENIVKEFENKHVSKAFFSVDGADIKFGYTLTDTNVCDTINLLCSKCDEVFLAVDQSKYGKRTFIKIADIDFPHSVIINEGTPAKYKQFYLNHNIPVYTSSILNNNSGNDE